MIPEKPCFGHGPAKGFGCGKPIKVEYRKHGLGKMCCYPDWLFSDNDLAKIEKNKLLNFAKKSVVKQNKAKDKEAKVKLISNDKFRKLYIQPVINEISRLVDFEQPCTATGLFGKMNGGHYISTGANRTLTYNLHNIHIQSFESNHFKSGDPVKYEAGIRRIYSDEYFEFMKSLQRCPELRLTRFEMEELLSKAQLIRLELKRGLKRLNSIERIGMRNKINIELSIYAPEYCVFEIKRKYDDKIKQTN